MEGRRAKLPSKIVKIDLHTHIIPREWPNWNNEFNSSGWITIEHNSDNPHEANLVNSNGSVFRKINSNCWDPQKRLEECNESNVTIQVLSTIPGIGFNYDKPADQARVVAKYLNNHLSEVVSGQERFLGLGTVPLQDADLAITEMERCILELGLVGIQIGTSFDGQSLDSSSLESFWKRAEELQCPIFVHPWEMSKSESRAQKYWFPWLLGMPHETAIAIGSLLLGGVIERHSRLRICFAHGGGCFAALVGRISHGFQARPDLCQTVTSTDPSILMKRIWVDSLVHDGEMLEVLIKKFGIDKVMMGSDYPFPLGEIERPGSLIEEVILDQQEADLLLYTNALNFLNLSSTS